MEYQWIKNKRYKNVSLRIKDGQIIVTSPVQTSKEFVDTFQEGIKVNDSAFIDLHEDVNNEYKQYYTENTNILNTEIRNTYNITF